MFTSVDKAIVAIVMAILFIINAQWGINIGLDEATVTAILAVLTPLFVYFVPNKGTKGAVK